MAIRLTSFEDLLVEQLKEIYSAEIQLVAAFPRIAASVHTPDLQLGFEKQAGAAKQHALRLEAIFADWDAGLRGNKCTGMEGLLLEANGLIKGKNISPQILEAGLIGVAQKIARYQVISYRLTLSYAERLGLEKAVDLLQQTLKEELETDMKLATLVQNHIG